MRKVDSASGGPNNRQDRPEPNVKRLKNVPVPALDTHASRAIAKAHTWRPKGVGRIIPYDSFKRLLSS